MIARSITGSMFPCTGCGCCCKRVDKGVENIKRMTSDPTFDFPYQWDESGKCEKLTDDNRCAVYEDRPLVCKIDELMLVAGIEKELYYKLTAQACNKMMQEDSIDISLRVNL